MFPVLSIILYKLSSVLRGEWLFPRHQIIVTCMCTKGGQIAQAFVEAAIEQSQIWKYEKFKNSIRMDSYVYQTFRLLVA